MDHTLELQKFKRPESVLVVIFTAAGEVLLLERQQPRGFWQSVTGSLEWGEGIEAAAVREVREETGLVADGLVATGEVNRYPILPAWRHKFAPEVEENVEHVFLLPLATPPAIAIDPREHHVYRWMPRNAALARASSPTNRAAIERYVPESTQ